MNNSDLRQDIIDELEFEPSIDAADIGVAVEAGVVTLNGHVPTYAQRTTAEDVVQRLSGVVGVNNNIEIKPHASATDVKKRVEEALRRNAELEPGAIKVRVVGDEVTLAGKVHAWSGRGAAGRAEWSGTGVRTVDDRITVSGQDARAAATPDRQSPQPSRLSR